MKTCDIGAVICTPPCSNQDSGSAQLSLVNSLPENSICLVQNVDFYSFFAFLYDFFRSICPRCSFMGRVEDATVSGDAYNTGGAITVNGFAMNIPGNLLVQFPAAWVPTAVNASTPTDAAVKKRGSTGRWYGRARKTAIADAENNETTDPVFMEVAPQPEKKIRVST